MNRINHLPWLLVLLFFLSAANLVANNLTVSNVTTTGQDVSAGVDNPDNFIFVDFDISWNNSFRDATNWDAAWVFAKWKNTSGVWHHATLNTTGFTAPTGSTISVEDNVGAFIYRDADGTGTFSKTGVQLRWNYGADGVTDNQTVTVKVFAIEMVYVPTGNFYVGDGSSSGTLRAVGSNTAVEITSSGVIIKSNGTSDDDTQLEGNGILVDGDGGIDEDGTTTISNASYPTGYNDFYCMKYEITQEQYVEFLNTLTYAQQDQRTGNGTPVSPAGTKAMSSFAADNRNGIEVQTAGVSSSTPAVYACDFTNDNSFNQSNDGQNIACNYLSWADGAAYADWAGLRPMTELEYEKACRGDQSSVANEFAWGTASIANAKYTLSNSGQSSEGINSNYSTTGNAIYYTTEGSINGPLRVGIFAANGANTGRVTSGATYYGMMEMTGNLSERFVTLGNPTGRAYSGLHGNGVLNSSGDADVTSWPNANGAGFRGGSLVSSESGGQVSYRGGAANAVSGRNYTYGFRAGRFAP